MIRLGDRKQDCFLLASRAQEPSLPLFGLQGGNHGLFGNSTAQSRGLHTPVQPLNSSPGLRAQVPPQFISPQVSSLNVHNSEQKMAQWLAAVS